jgi:hypothetical protein
MSEDYDYNRYEQIIQRLLDTMWYDPDELEIGENISDISDVKIIFDGHGDLETEDENGEYVYEERGDKNMESYAIFIHRDAATEDDWEFPEHELTPWCLIHRPSDEVCIYAWHDVVENIWTINSLEETSDHEMSNAEVMKVLDRIWNKYYMESILDISNINVNGNNWPFPTGDK